MNVNKLLPRLSIRAKLVIAFALLTIAPLTLVAIVAVVGWAQHLHDNTRMVVEYDLEIARLQVANSLHQAEQHVGYLAEVFLEDDPVAGPARLGRAEEMFATFLSTDSTAIFRVKVIDTEGNLLFQAVRSGWPVADREPDRSGEIYYLMIAEDVPRGGSVVLPVELEGPGEPHEMIPAIAILKPMRGVDGEPRGVVVAEAEAAALFAGIDRAAPGLAGTTGLVNRGGFFLYHSERKKDWANLLANRASIDLVFDYPVDVVEQILSGKAGTLSPDGDEILAFRPLASVGDPGGDGLILYRSVSLDALQETSRIFLGRVALIGAGILLLVLGAAVVASEQFTSPIYALRASVRTLAEGGETDPPEIETNDEIEDLAEDFSVMARALTRHRHELEEMVAERTRELDAARAELMQVVAHAADAIIGLDREGRVRFWNQGAGSLFGFQPEEAVGRPVDELIGPPGAEFVGESEFIRGTLDAGRPIVDLQTLRATRDGTAIPVRLAQAPILGEDGQPVGSSLVIRDDRLRSRLEEQLRRSERLAAMSVMAASLAHEINNPLAIVGNRIELMRREADRSEDARQHRHLEVLHKHVDRLRELTSDLLRFAREGGDEMAPLAPGVVVERVARLLENAFVSRGVRLDVSVLGDVPEIVGNASAIETATANLLLNALQATPAGGRVKVEVSGSGDGNFVDLVIHDTGPGVSPEVRGRIFEPFFTTKGAAGGTGLGLAVCRAVLERHGGRVWLDDGGESGSHFVARFPVRRGRS